MYVLGRAAHLVFYAFHLGLARSLAWFAAMGGLLLVWSPCSRDARRTPCRRRRAPRPDRR
jgi:hypothetical protein